ncbi:YceI family protein [Runella sp.]|uniref:YceI family protein n=1 Tax=Runella sp. TaxID=1960881 RepID=UPI003D119732
MKTILVLVICVSISGNGISQTWQPIASSIGFSVKMLGVTVQGSFKGLSATLKFNPETLNTNSISATVDAASVDTDNSLRNRHLREKEDFFEVAKYPNISLKSTKFEKAPNGYIGYFELTIKSITKIVKVPFTFSESNNKATFSGTCTINRRDWAIGGNTFGMSNDVTIHLTANTILK